MIEKIRSLCNKYQDQGLDIWIEFNFLELILIAYWYDEKGKLMTYRRCYCYSNGMNLKVLFDRFADETLAYKRSGLI